MIFDTLPVILEPMLKVTHGTPERPGNLSKRLPGLRSPLAMRPDIPDQQIDALGYELYDISYEEIGIVEVGIDFIQTCPPFDSFS